MPVTLRVVGRRAESLGALSRWTFGAQGGSIGRAADNDWVLPDPDRLLSNYHAQIEADGTDVRIVDLSTNGIFLNGAREALGRGQSHKLADGDRLRLGPYRVEVSLTAVAPSRPASAPLPMGEDTQHLRTDVIPSLAPYTPFLDARAAPATGGGIAAFFRGAGLEPPTLTPDEGTATLALAGQLLRELVTGLVAAERRRAQDERRGDAPSPRPSALADLADVSSVVQHLLFPGPGRASAPIEAVRASFRERERHADATRLATSDAVRRLIETLAPPAIESRLRDLPAMHEDTLEAGAQHYSPHYLELFRRITQTGPEGVPAAFAEAFLAAYEAANDRLRGGRESA
jgi:predicted component of type VI protein secretion system